jgi:hypothetical protein
MLATQTAPGAGAARSEFNGEHDSIKPAADRSHHQQMPNGDKEARATMP